MINEDDHRGVCDKDDGSDDHEELYLVHEKPILKAYDFVKTLGSTYV